MAPGADTVKADPPFFFTVGTRRGKGRVQRWPKMGKCDGEVAGLWSSRSTGWMEVGTREDERRFRRVERKKVDRWPGV
jgi:hypothetical protein